jgi:hypothetical protein
MRSNDGNGLGKPAGENVSRLLNHVLHDLRCWLDLLDEAGSLARNQASQAGETLPDYLSEAVELFESPDFIERNLGIELQRIYSLGKWQENAVFRSKITELEYKSWLGKQ